jgi:hypothetical protein
MSGTEAETPKNYPTWFHYTVAGLSFIPLLGAFVGLVCILWGLSNRRFGGLKIAYIGAAGVLTTVALYGGLAYLSFYFRKSGKFDGAYAEMAQKNLNTTMALIETYKNRYGHYPASLDNLKGDGIATSVLIDPFPPFKQHRNIELLFYSLEKNGNYYYLLSVGPDDIPFTQDDLVPELPLQNRENWGLLIKPR